MKEFYKKIAGLSMAFFMLFSTAFMLMPKVSADGAYDINFQAEGTHTMTIDGGVLKIDNVNVTLRNGDNDIGEASCTDETHCKIRVNEGTAGTLNYNAGGAFALFDTNGHVEYVFSSINTNKVFLVENAGGNNGGGNEQQANTNGTVTYTYTGSPAMITINGGQFDVERANNTVVVNQTTKISTGEVSYNYESGTVEICVETLFIERLTALTINGTPVDVNKTPDQLLHMTRDQRIQYIANVEKADSYVIATTTTENLGEYMTVGNFLWSYMDVDKGTDDYVGNGNFEFVNINWNGDDYSLQDLIDNDYGFMEWNEWENRDTHQMEGGAMLPAGAIITVRLIPNAGYQLTSFTINGGEFEAGDNDHVGIYTFEVPRGNFHLGAHFTKVKNEVDAEDADAVVSGSIKLGGAEESMAAGTAKLGISNVDLEPAQISNFKDAAGDYNVKTYLDISLFNTIYKGTADDAWDKQVDELNHKATITLKLADDVDGNDIVIVHEKHDGTYEVIETVYNEKNHTITFVTDSFSNYAIASRTINKSNPKTGDNVAFYSLILLISAFGLYSKSKKKA